MSHSLYFFFTNRRLLGLRDGSRLGFWRNLIGQGEKWQVLKASASQLASIGGSGLAGLGGGGGGTGSSMSLSGIGMGMQSMGATSRGCEDLEARGKYVRTGDAILLQTYKSDHLLSLHEALYGPEAKLVFRDRAGLGSEVWQVEQFNSVGLPAWYLNRPYLRYVCVCTSCFGIELWLFLGVDVFWLLQL